MPGEEAQLEYIYIYICMYVCMYVRTYVSVSCVYWKGTWRRFYGEGWGRCDLPVSILSMFDRKDWRDMLNNNINIELHAVVKRVKKRKETVKTRERVKKLQVIMLEK